MKLEDDDIFEILTAIRALEQNSNAVTDAALAKRLGMRSDQMRSTIKTLMRYLETQGTLVGAKTDFPDMLQERMVDISLTAAGQEWLATHTKQS